jgi:hypothetical protein
MYRAPASLRELSVYPRTTHKIVSILSNPNVVASGVSRALLLRGYPVRMLFKNFRANHQLAVDVWTAFPCMFCR